MRGATGLSWLHLPVPKTIRSSSSGHLLAQRRRVQRHAVGEVVEDGLRRGLHPGCAVGGDPGLGDVLGEAAELGGGDARGGAAPGRRKEVAGEGEQGAAHGQLLDQQPGVVEDGVDVGDAQPVHPCLQGEVDGGWLGGVQDGHGTGGADRVGMAVLGVDAVAPGQPRTALDVRYVLHRAMIAHRASDPESTRASLSFPPELNEAQRRRARQPRADPAPPRFRNHSLTALCCPETAISEHPSSTTKTPTGAGHDA